MTHTAALIPVALIVAGDNDRTVFDAEKLAGLADAIQSEGLHQPPTVRPLADGRYELVMGERRVRAMRDVLGWTEIPCQVRAMDDDAASAAMLAENDARADLNPVDAARAYRKRLDSGWSMERLCAVTGRRPHYIERHLALLELGEQAQDFVQRGALSLAHAALLQGLDVNRQHIALRIFSHAPTMSLIRWRDVLGRLREEQALDDQTPLFDLDAWTVPAALTAASKGRQAVTGVPAGRDVPPVRRAQREAMAAIFERYLLDLHAAGQHEAAQAVGNLYNTFVAMGVVTVTSNLHLPARQPGIGTAGDNLHEELI